MSRTAPLFRPDPGWLFTIAGLAVMVVSALLPAERDLHELRQQVAALEVRETFNEQRIAAYERFMHDLSERDPALVRRLAASQLNLMPEGEQPLLMATSIEHTVSDWIEATVTPPAFTPVPPPDTLLSRLADGSRRLWLMGGGAMVVFLGIVMGFGVSARPEIELGPEAAAFARAATAAATVEPADAETEQAPDDAMPTPEADGGQSLELPLETVDVDHPQATAEPLEQEIFQWPEQTAPFEPSCAESGATFDGSVAAAWQAEQDAVADDGDRTEVVAGDDADWLREHGSD